MSDRPPRRRRLRVALIGVGLFLLLLVGVLLFITGSEPGSRWLTGQVMTRIQAQVPFKLTVGSIRRYGLTRWAIGPVEGREPSSDRLFLFADRVTFDLRYEPLISGRIVLSRAHIDSLFLAAWLDSADALHPQLTAREADSLTTGALVTERPFPLSIEDLSIGGLLVGLDVPRQQFYTRYHAVDVGGQGSGNAWSGRVDGRLTQRSPWTADSLAGGLKIVLGVSQEAVTVDTLSWALPGFRINAQGGWYFQDSEARIVAEGYAALDSLSLRIPGLAGPRGRVDWTADITAGRLPPQGVVTIDLNGITAASLPPALAGGILSGHGRFEGALTPPDSLTGEAKFQVTGLESSGALNRIDAVVRLDHSRLDLTAEGPGLKLTARGVVIDSVGPDVAFHLILADVARFIGIGSRVSGRLETDGRVTGSWRAPEAAARLASPELSLFGHKEPDVTGTVSYADSAVVFRIENQRGAQLSGRAALGGGREIAADLVVPRIDLAEIRAALPDSLRAMVPDGIATANGHVEGTLKRRRGFLSVTTGPLRPFGAAVDTVYARADFEPGNARLTGTLLRPGDGGRIDLTGDVPLDRTGDLPAVSRVADTNMKFRFSELRLETAELDSLRRALLKPVTGDTAKLVLSADGMVTLALRPGTKRPPVWTVVLDQATLASENARLETEAPLEARGSGERIEVQPFRIALITTASDSTVTSGVVEGRLTTDNNGALSGEIRTDAVAMSAVATLLPGLPALEGSVSAVIRPGGDARSPERMNFTARLDWLKPGRSGVSLDPLSTQLHGNASGWMFDSLFAVAGNDTALGSGSVRRPPGGGPSVIDISLKARAFHLESIPFPEAVIRKLEGILDADARITGTVDAPDLTGFVRIRSGAVQTPDMSIPVDHVNAWLRLDGRVVHIDTLEVGRNRNVLASGTVTMNDGKPPALDLLVTVDDFDLKSVPLPPGSVRLLEGKMNGAARMTGTAETPDLQGTLALTHGALQAGPMLLPVRNVAATLRLNGAVVLVDSMHTDGPGGRAELTGQLDLTDSANLKFDIHGNLNGLILNLDPGVQMGLTGPLTLRGSLKSSRFTSDLRISDGRYEEQFDLRRFLAQRRTVIVQSATSRELLDGLVLDLHVSTRRAEDFNVDNNLADIPLSLDLRISGTALDWRIAGTAEAEPNTGRVYYLDREFKVTRLSATFDNPKYPDPTLDVSAETSITSGETYDITLNITGRASDTRTFLSSDPSLSQPDIAALLTLGVPVSGLAGGSGSGSATDVFLNRARELTTSTIFSLAGRRAADLTGLSRVHFSTAEGGIESTRVTLGKDFGRRLSVDTTTSIADPKVPRLELNWRLFRGFSIRSIGDQAAESSLDLRYVLRYR